ncbi:MAG: LytTR family DNA-binding domain-containing protein [Maritimibacter sp.]
MGRDWLTFHPKGRDLQTLLRSYIVSVQCVGISVFMATFLGLFAPGGMLLEFPVWLRVTLHNANIILFLGWTYAFLPLIFRVCLARGWPFLLLQSLSYLPPIVLITSLFTILQGDAVLSVAMIINTTMLFFFIVIAIVAGHLLFWIYALPGSGVQIDPRHFWQFRLVTPCALQPHLTPQTRGRVLRMLAENQYVRVFTEAGEDLVRLTLSEAETLVPKGAGLRIHRSHWVATDQMDAFRFEGGNPRLTTKSGEVLPVSRGKVEDLRGALFQQAKA